MTKQNGLREIKAVKAHLTLAQKAKTRTSANLKAANASLKNAEAVFKAALKAKDAAIKVRNAAKKEDYDATTDLKEAKNALEDAHRKWEIIDVDASDDECESKKQKRTVDILKVKSFEVKGCGSQVFNGTYTKYSASDRNCFFQQKIDWISGKWWILSFEEGYDKSMYKYESNEFDDIIKPPVGNEWKACRGMQPPPQVEVKELFE